MGGVCARAMNGRGRRRKVRAIGGEEGEAQVVPRKLLQQTQALPVSGV